MSTPTQSIRVSAKAPSNKRLLLRRIVSVLAFAYLAGLVACCVALYFIGESWWVTSAALYAPRVALALPLPFLVAALWWVGSRRALWAQLAAAFLVVVPLMGFVVPWPSLGSKGPTLRLLTFNVDSAYSGAPGIIAQIEAFSPDIVLLEEVNGGGDALSEALRVRYPFVETSTQFIIASRFRIQSTTDPDKIPFEGRERSPRFMRYSVETRLGVIALYCVHPISPRGVLHLNRFRGAWRQVLSGELLGEGARQEVESNAGLRSLQIATMAAQATRERQPVLIAGDTNLPGMSATFRKWLAGYQDGFRARGWGFGYTFPAKRPFLRLDRILASDELRFVSFQIGCRGVSDHLCAVADIEARP